MRTRAGVFALLTILAATGCGGGNSASSRRTVTVFASASLTDVFRAMEKSFAADHDRYQLRFSFAGDQQLITQVQHGAPVDTIATADRTTMARVEPKKLHRAPVLFARNRLVIAVRPGNPLRIARLSDLARPGVRVVLAAPAVPAGRYAREALSNAGVSVRPVSLEDSVEGVVTKVASGDADAGIVYATDARATNRGIEPVRIPSADNVEAEYFVMVMPGAKQKAGGEQFASYLLSSSGRKMLERFGYAVP